MEVEVNYLAVFLAALSSMVVGAVWYSPAGFFNQWSRLAHIKHDPSKMTGKQMAWLYGGVFVASLTLAYVLAHVSFLSNQFFKHTMLQDALTTAFWLWLGFTPLAYMCTTRLKVAAKNLPCSIAHTSS